MSRVRVPAPNESCRDRRDPGDEHKGGRSRGDSLPAPEGEPDPALETERAEEDVVQGVGDKTCCSTNTSAHTNTLTNPLNYTELANNMSAQRAFRRGWLPSSLPPLNRTDERFRIPQSVSYFNMSELGVISLLITSQNPSFTTRIQSVSDYNEKIMIDRIKDRIGIDWSATRPGVGWGGREKRARKEWKGEKAGREVFREKKL